MSDESTANALQNNTGGAAEHTTAPGQTAPDTPDAAPSGAGASPGAGLLDAGLLGGDPGESGDSGQDEEQEGGEGSGSGEDGQDPGSRDAPAEYADFTVPPDFQVDAGIMSEFKETARGMKLTQEQAQSLVDLQLKTQEATVRAFHQQIQAWREEAENDPEFGGENLEQTVTDARSVLFAHPEGKALQQELIRTGYANHPAIIKFLARIARENPAFYREGTVLTGKEAGHGEKPLSERLWPDK